MTILSEIVEHELHVLAEADPESPAGCSARLALALLEICDGVAVHLGTSRRLGSPVEDWPIESLVETARNARQERQQLVARAFRARARAETLQLRLKDLTVEQTKYQLRKIVEVLAGLRDGVAVPTSPRTSSTPLGTEEARPDCWDDCDTPMGICVCAACDMASPTWQELLEERAQQRRMLRILETDLSMMLAELGVAHGDQETIPQLLALLTTAIDDREEYERK
jgi:hypothetical protein